MFKRAMRIVGALFIIAVISGGMTALAAGETWSGGGSKSNPYLIQSIADLKLLADNVNDGTMSGTFTYFKLTTDLDYSGYTYADGDKGWKPIGNNTTNFKGEIDGNNHVIKNLMINRPDENYVGLIGYGLYADIVNLGMTGGSITGYQYVGSIAGLNKDGKISNCYNTGSVNGNKDVGGIIGQNLNPGEGDGVINCYNTGNVTGSEQVGGIVGLANSKSIISNCFNTGNVSGKEDVGGVVGLNESDVQNCYNTGSITGTYANIGGVAGANGSIGSSGTTSRCYSAGVITGGGGRLGSIVGYLAAGSVNYSYYNSEKCIEPAIGYKQSGTTVGLDARTTSSMTASETLSMGLYGLGDAWQKRKNTGSESYYPELKVFANSTNAATAAASKLSVTIRNSGGSGNTSDDSGITYIDGTISLTDATAPYINLATETIGLGSFSVAAYSLDSGNKWKKGDLPTGDKFKKLLDKGMTLWVSDGWNAKDIKEDKKVVEKKGVPANATIICFPKIEKRPKANAEKLKPFFLSDTWEPRKGGTAAASAVYEWAETTDKKTAAGAWQLIPENGFSIQSGKTKVTYLFRTPAVADGETYTPASKAFKLTPANFGKAPNYKIKTDKNTEKQTIKLKTGDYYQIDDATPVKAPAGNFDVTNLSGTLKVWKGETGKKPRSEVQEIRLTET